MALDLTGQSRQILSPSGIQSFEPMSIPVLSAHLRRLSTVITDMHKCGKVRSLVSPGLCAGFRRGKSVASESENAETGLLGALRRLLANVNGI